MAVRDVLLRCAAACVLLISIDGFCREAADLDRFEPPEGEQDCGVDDDTRGTTPCRLRRSESIAAIHAQLEQGQAVVREDDSLLIAYRGNAQQVLMAGGLNFGLSRIPGSDLWMVRLRIPSLDHLVLSFRFLRDGERPSLEIEPIRWRGPKAPPAIPFTSTLRGDLSELSIASAALAEARPTSTYEPPPVDGQPVSAIVYVADGRLLPVFAKAIEPRILSRELPRIVLVGLHAAEGPRRALEYVSALGAKSGEFAAHQAFLLDDVIPTVEGHQLEAESKPLPRWLLGVSNGADWALETGFRHPGMFSCVIAFSPGWPLAPARVSAASDQSFPIALASGTLEAEFNENTRSIADLLAAHGRRHQHQEWVSGHDMEMWLQSLPEALQLCAQPDSPG